MVKLICFNSAMGQSRSLTARKVRAVRGATRRNDARYVEGAGKGDDAGVVQAGFIQSRTAP